MFKKIISGIALAFLCSCSFGQNKNIAATRAYCDHNRTIAAQDAVTQLKPALEDYIVDEVDRVSRSFITNAYPVPIPITNTIYQTIDNVISNRVIYETTNVLVYSEYSFVTNSYYNIYNNTNVTVNITTNNISVIERTTNYIHNNVYISVTNMYPGPFSAITTGIANVESLYVTKDLTFGSDSTASMGSVNISGDVSIDGNISQTEQINTGRIVVDNDSLLKGDVDIYGDLNLYNKNINSVSNLTVNKKITVGTKANNKTVIEDGSIENETITTSYINGDYYNGLTIGSTTYFEEDVAIEGNIDGNSNGDRQYICLNNAQANLWSLTLDNLFVNNILSFKGGSFSTSNLVVKSIHNDKPYTDLTRNKISVDSQLDINAQLNINDTAVFNNGFNVNGGISADVVYLTGKNFITNIYTDLDIGRNLNVSQKIKSRDAELGYVTAQSLDVEGTITASNLNLTNNINFGSMTVRTPFTVTSTSTPLNQRDATFEDVNVTFYRSPIKLIGTDDTNIDIGIQTTKIKIVTNHFDVVGADLKIDRDASDKGGKITSHELKTTTITSSTINNSGSIYANSMMATNVTANRVNVNNKTLLDSDGSIALNFDGGLDDIIIDNDGIEMKGNRTLSTVSENSSSGGKIITDHIETVNDSAVNILHGNTTVMQDMNIYGGLNVSGQIVANGNIESKGIVKCQAIQANDIISTNVLYANYLNIKSLSSKTNYVGNTTIYDRITVDLNNQQSTIGVVKTDLVESDTIDVKNVIFDNLNTSSLQVTNITKGIMYQVSYDYQGAVITNKNLVAEHGLKDGLTIDSPVFLTGTASTSSAFLKPFWVYVEGKAEPIPMVIRFRRKSADSFNANYGILEPTFYDVTQYNLQPDGTLEFNYMHDAYPFNYTRGEDYD